MLEAVCVGVMHAPLESGQGSTAIYEILDKSL